MNGATVRCVRTLNLTHSEARSHWRVLSRSLLTVISYVNKVGLLQIFTKSISSPHNKTCVFITFQSAALSEGSVPSLPTSVTPVRTRVLIACEGTAGMCLQPPQRSLKCVLAQPLPSGPCCPNTLHTAEPGCSALTAEIKHRLQVLETC